MVWGGEVTGEALGGGGDLFVFAMKVVLGVKCLET
jgi:hypothetical protein